MSSILGGETKTSHLLTQLSRVNQILVTMATIKSFIITYLILDLTVNIAQHSLSFISMDMFWALNIFRGPDENKETSIFP